jgi:hypothetical protein
MIVTRCYAIHKFYSKKSKLNYIIDVCQVIIELALVGGPILIKYLKRYVYLISNWVPTHYIFLGAQSTIFYMKISSYHQCIKKHGSTNNIPSHSAFFYFLIAPTLCYEEKYPRSKSFRFQQFLYHLLICVLCLVKS